MRRGILAGMVLLAMCGIVWAQEEAAPAPAEAVASGPGIDNLFIEAGGGVMMPDGEDPTPLGYVAANFGYPVLDQYGLGGQVGAKLTARNEDPDFLLSAGMLQRGVDLGSTNGAWSMQLMYQRTWEQADLFIVKPTLGVDIDKSNYLALTGVWGLNDRTVGPGGSITQQPTDQALLMWGSMWDDVVTTEIGAGYEFQDVDSMLIAAHAGYQLSNVTNVNFTGVMDFEGNYCYGVSFGFDLGGNRRNATLNNITKRDANDYTPFPLGSLPVMFYETITCPTEEIIIPEE